MQNSGQPYRGSPAPGVNYNDHSYDNQIGVHCQPSGYQPYANPPYHPIPSPRPHHYGNHQMQQGMPYRHHGGAYAPNQNQYGPGMNQDMYRNHVPNYMSGNRNMPGKPWTENNASGEMMQPYNQVSSHPQMMNNPPQMTASTMRSPPHGTSNMNVTPPGGPQHFRQMQSPAHSPHSWSQSQMPSPGVMHSSRTTPSPLPAHVRSPGHSQQPFSPPSSAHIVNMQPHTPSSAPENGQIPPMNSAGNDNHNPSNPLHSLQKMVLLDSDSKQNMMPLSNDSNEQVPNLINQNFAAEEGSNSESKDSNYSTYYNLDENRFESKPNNTSNDASVYGTVQQVTVCNFPVPTLPISPEADLNALPGVPNNTNAQMLNTNSPPLHSSNSSVAEQNQGNILLNHNPNDSAMKLNECPPHAESAPAFTDQSQASMSTNTEQALNSNVSSKPISNIIPIAVRTLISSKGHSADIQSKSVKMIGPETATSNLSSKTVTEGSVFEFSNTTGVQIKVENNPESAIESDCKSANIKSTNSEKCSNVNLNQNDASDEPSSSSHLDSQDSKQDSKSPSIVKLNPLPSDGSHENRTEVPNDVKEELKSYDSENNPDSKKPSLRQRKAGANYEEAPSPESELKGNLELEARILKKPKGETKKTTSKQNILDEDDMDHLEREIARNPVKVVIHRIRKSDTSDTWHVPGGNNKAASSQKDENETKPIDTKISNVGPQIIILSPAMSQKKFGIKSPGSTNSITIKEDQTIETEERNISKDSPAKKRSSLNSSDKSDSSPKKKGRPFGSKNKSKPSNSPSKRRRGKKFTKKKKFENPKEELAPKLKKAKPFLGPYVHITGSKNKPSSIAVVNVAQKEEEKDVSKIPKIKRNFNTPVNRIKKKRVGHLSTLSPTYDAFNKDKTWLCVFCHKGSHHGGLGDLYGPYYVKDRSLENDKSSNMTPSSCASGRSKRRRSDINEDSKGSKRARQNSGKLSGSFPTDASAASHSHPSPDGEDTLENFREVWLHEDCAVWCQSISLLGEEVHGLEDAILEANENICSQCSLNGATVGCWGKACKQLYHFRCAKDTNCQMDIQNFSLLCPKHQKSTDKKTRSQ